MLQAAQLPKVNQIKKKFRGFYNMLIADVNYPCETLQHVKTGTMDFLTDLAGIPEQYVTDSKFYNQFLNYLNKFNIC